MAERRSRLIVSWIFLLIFCLSAPLAVVAGWARASLLTVDDAVGAIGDLAADTNLRNVIARTIADRVGETVRGENPTATAALLAGAASETMAAAANDVVASPQFAEIWREDVGSLYRLLIGAANVRQAAPAVLDLSPLLPLLRRELAERQISLPEGVTLTPEDLQITLFDAQVVDRFHQIVQRVDLAAWVLLVVAFATLVLSIALASERLAAVERAGFGLAIGMIVLIAALVIARSWVASAVEDGGAVLGVILDAISQSLQLTAVGLAVAGLLVGCLSAGLRALRRGTTPRDFSLAE